MGHPKHQRKKFANPKKPYNKERIEKERKLLRDYGLRRKHEIWRAEAILRNFRTRAKDLQAVYNEKLFNEMIDKLRKNGIQCTSLDDIMSINIDNILSRRLQTVVYKKGYANTPKQARQMIVHGHIFIADRKVKWPSYSVLVGEEDSIHTDINILKKEKVGE